jgi:hypothetical protein
MVSKKHRDTHHASGHSPETDTDDIYLPVCCGEFGLRQAADLRDLWEATWSQDRRGRRNETKASPSESEKRPRDTVNDYSDT